MKKVLATMLLCALLFTACTSNGNTTSEESTPESEETTVTDERLTGLTQNEYPDLEITAAVLERKAILPGDTIRIAITITNNGDSPVVYVKGSGSAEVPQALYVTADGLQPILPKGNLGIQTLDYVTLTCEPGETLRFDMYVRAIQPNAEFDTYTYDLYMQDQTYIGELPWEELSEMYPTLEIAETGQYTVHVNFIYSITPAGETPTFGDEATGYNTAEVQIGIM